MKCTIAKVIQQCPLLTCFKKSTSYIIQYIKIQIAEQVTSHHKMWGIPFWRFKFKQILQMESSVDWSNVDLIISDLVGLFNTQLDIEAVEEANSKFNTEREAFQHEEESLRGLAAGRIQRWGST